MKNSEGKNKLEAKEAALKIRTPINEAFVLVVRTKPELTNYRKGIPEPEAAEAVIEDAHTGSVVVDLGRLLMENAESGRSAFFEIGEEESAEPVSRSVSLSLKELEDPRNIFGILHELGHIAAHDRRSATHREKLEAANEKYEQSPKREDLQAIIQDERDAWAHAVVLARAMKREYGVDLFRLFRDADEFMGWLRVTGLRAWEAELEKLGMPGYTKDQKVEAWQRSVQDGSSLREYFEEESKNAA